VYRFLGYASAFTTVEKPDADVSIGIYNVIKKLEHQVGEKFALTELLISENHTKQSCSTTEEANSVHYPCYEVDFLSTSSAGGGLQILVVGLTKLSSLQSAISAANGAGGVIIETISIDDKKSSFQKIETLNCSHPDLILFCGGTDGGALFSVYRLAEIIKVAKTKQKFSTSTNIPLIYAGNKEASSYLSVVFQNKHDLHVVPNLRPCLEIENITPTKKKIQELYLTNVMEQAPGYPKIKRLMKTNIIPTPVGFLNTFTILCRNQANILAFDMGGATTDIYTHLYDSFHRTVSANIGMSYSIGNILALTNYSQNYEPYFQHFYSSYNKNNSKELQEYFYNYVGNKVLYPDFKPHTEIDCFIEHLLALNGLKIAFQQHFQDHYLNHKVGISKKKHKFLRQKQETGHYIPLNIQQAWKKFDFKMMIGAGGIFCHVTPKQALFIFIESFHPFGVIEFWRDKQFVLPHLGVLATVDENIANALLYNDCLQKLALYIHPYCTTSDSRSALITIKFLQEERVYQMKQNEFYYYTSSYEQKISFSCAKSCYLPQTEVVLAPHIPLIIDTRDFNDPQRLKTIVQGLNPYSFSENIRFAQNLDKYHSANPMTTIEQEKVFHQYQIKCKLPFPGFIYVQPNDDVTPDTLVGENKFSPPRIYVVLLSTLLQRTLTSSEITSGLQIQINDQVDTNTVLFKSLSPKKEIAFSPLRGKVESIDFHTGTIILQEIQDYPLEPVNLNVAQQLGIEPHELLPYMKRKKGEFVMQGELLAERMSLPNPMLLQLFPEASAKIYANVQAPCSGTIKEINSQTGMVTICYDQKPHRMYANCFGRVHKIFNHQETIIVIKAIKIDGKIGFGQEIGGKLVIYQQGSICSGDIVFTNKSVTSNDLLFFQEEQIAGLICNTITYSCIKLFLQKDIGVVLTGGEQLPFTIMVMKGFSHYHLNDNYNLFLSNAGKYVLIKPQTQIRAGATRPTIYIMENNNSS